MVLYTFMDQNRRVLPSNAPALPDGTSHQPSTSEEPVGTLSQRICHDFNRGFDCKNCHNLHVCLICRRNDHSAGECKAGVLQVTSGNAGADTFALGHAGANFDSPQPCGSKTDPLPTSLPLQSLQATVRYEQRIRHVRRAERVPNYWHVEFNTPRYQAYRDKCRQKGSKEKWSDRVEEAFQIGM